MEEDTRPVSYPRSRRKCTTKVKSGCRTCKIRKVKCDERRPACYRCLSTGRTCDGYGIWGGGGSRDSAHQSKILREWNLTSLVPQHPPGLAPIAGTEHDQHCYEWLRSQSARRAPGIFVLALWDKLIFQASLSEPAVLHAILALSSLHRKESLGGNDRSCGELPPDEQEQFMLQHYSQAISHLSPHFSSRSSFSKQVALITCIIFISLEFLRGRISTAVTHLKEGLRIIEATQFHSDVNQHRAFPPKPVYDWVDIWILNALSRIQVQMQLFKQCYKHPCSNLQTSEPEQLTKFPSIDVAWRQLELLLNYMVFLTKRRDQQQVADHVNNPSALTEHQQCIQRELKCWFEAYEASKTVLQGQEGEDLTLQPLCVYRAMSNMAYAYLWSDSGPGFDVYNNPFISLVNELSRIQELRPFELRFKQRLPDGASSPPETRSSDDLTLLVLGNPSGFSIARDFVNDTNIQGAVKLHPRPQIQGVSVCA
jgi:hypothetical protein